MNTLNIVYALIAFTLSAAGIRAYETGNFTVMAVAATAALATLGFFLQLGEFNRYRIEKMLELNVIPVTSGTCGLVYTIWLYSTTLEQTAENAFFSVIALTAFFFELIITLGFLYIHIKKLAKEIRQNPTHEYAAKWLIIAVLILITVIEYIITKDITTLTGLLVALSLAIGLVLAEVIQRRLKLYKWDNWSKGAVTFLIMLLLLVNSSNDPDTIRVYVFMAHTSITYKVLLDMWIPTTKRVFGR